MSNGGLITTFEESFAKCRYLNIGIILLPIIDINPRNQVPISFK